jgi:hypothetical protein
MKVHADTNWSDEVATREREPAEFWTAPDLKLVPPIITDDVWLLAWREDLDEMVISVVPVLLGGGYGCSTTWAMPRRSSSRCRR